MNGKEKQICLCDYCTEEREEEEREGKREGKRREEWREREIERAREEEWWPLFHSFGFPQKVNLIDVHCHIDDSLFSSSLPSLFSQAEQRGVKAIFGVATNVKSSQEILSLSQKYPILRPFAAAHPVQGDRSVTRDEVEEAIRFIRDNHAVLVGIGECGLDFSPTILKNSPDPEKAKETQRWGLEEFASLSREYDLPLNVHSRSAGRPAIKVLQDSNAKMVNLHAFDGSTKVAKGAINSGYYLSVPPSVCRGLERQKQVQQLPLNKLLLETDAPALGPIKGETNYPSMLPLSAWQISKLHKKSFEEISIQTTENAKEYCPKAFL